MGTACRRRSPPLPPPPSRSRSSLPPRGSTPSGSEAPSWLPSPPSSRCGSPSRSTTSVAPPLSTASASKHLFSSVEEKQHTGSYHQHLHLLASGVLPSFYYPTIFPLPVVWTSFHSIRLSITFLLQF